MGTEEPYLRDSRAFYVVTIAPDSSLLPSLYPNVPTSTQAPSVPLSFHGPVHVGAGRACSSLRVPYNGTLLELRLATIGQQST